MAADCNAMRAFLLSSEAAPLAEAFFLARLGGAHSTGVNAAAVLDVEFTVSALAGARSLSATLLSLSAAILFFEDDGSSSRGQPNRFRFRRCQSRAQPGKMSWMLYGCMMIGRQVTGEEKLLLLSLAGNSPGFVVKGYTITSNSWALLTFFPLLLLQLMMMTVAVKPNHTASSL